MDRTDSAFDETFRLKSPQDEPAPIHRSNTAPTRHGKSRRLSPDLSSAPQSPTMELRRPESEQHSSTQRKPTDTHRRSITSSSDDSTAKSRRRGYGSLPSSRRTSCTVVDPSRPTRHYRIRSSQTCPTMGHDIDDALALHFRSCSLFQNPTYHSGVLPSPTISGYGVAADTDFGSTQRGMGTPPQAGESAKSLSPKESEGEAVIDVVPDTTMHWMSPDTRQTQYDKIDRANTGFRGFVTRLIPRCVSGAPQPKFYDHDKSDAGSVRRYRMDFEEPEDVEKEEDDEKLSSGLRMQHRKLVRSTMHKKKPKVKRWACF